MTSKIDNQHKRGGIMSTAAVLGEATGRSIAWSIVLMIFGLLALALPLAASVGVVIVIGWLVLFDGAAQLVHAFQSKGIGHTVWKLVVAVVYLAAGVYLIARPLIGVAGLTLVLGVFFIVEGVADIVAYFYTRKIGGSGWMLVDGIVTLILGAIVWAEWPVSSLWLIGTLVGISMLMTGITRLMMALAARRAAHIIEGKLAA
jgi:uncharacterized membrane protein HdeD (DUF308 family)